MINDNDILACKSIAECARILGYNYYNGYVKDKVSKYCESYLNTTIEEIVKRNAIRCKRFCSNCGKELKSSQRKFCSQSCSTSYTNKIKGKRKDETKKKISNSLIDRYNKILKDSIVVETQNRKREHLIRKHKCTCIVCGKEFFSKRKSTKHCSSKCTSNDESVKQKLRIKQLERVKNGTHIGWIQRNRTSYPEKFFKNVLDSNHIEYSRENFSTKRYFLDFLIIKNGNKIDLEIDGKQHKLRKEHDRIRDEFLTSKGYIVYRIEWNNINNEDGKTRMRQKIGNFLNFYNSL